MTWHYQSAAVLTDALRQGKVSSSELLEACIQRMQRFNPAINAVVVTDEERARRRAAEADAALARGEIWGPLHGLPMTVKETFELAGLPTTAGAPVYREHVSTNNASAVQRLLDAGAVIFGKTNVPLFAGDLQSYNSIYGQTSNPWNTERTCGGSSGGAAAALATGITPLELGSDIGGSIRTPAAFCGVAGHKPSYGLISKRGHVPGAPGSLSQSDISVAGPMARTVDDLELALDLLVGPEPDQGLAWRLELPPPRHRDLADFRVAAWLDDPACPVDAETVSLLTDLCGRLQREGARVDMQARPTGVSLEESHDIYYSLLTATMGAGLPGPMFDKMAEKARNLPTEDLSYEARFARGGTQSHAQWLRTHERRLQLGRAWAAFFQDVDVVLAPVTHVPAFPHDHSSPQYHRQLTVNGESGPYMNILVWAGLAGVVYLPSTVVPVARNADGLPIGVQIIGPYLEDRTTLAFAREVERLAGGFVPPPDYD
ncbi:MAG: amidase [Ectothiorhodospiraceae bacterium]|nr:amidase [Ectothiorhodospiraceae bacterium]